jgi:rRNA biogenesis protein RRP5
MAAHKRSLEDTSSAQKPKKSKISNEAGRNLQSATSTMAEEVDFPRGGGTSFTPLEVKTIRAEAVKEANEELFEVCPIEIL